jgi:hypothetical protein
MLKDEDVEDDENLSQNIWLGGINRHIFGSFKQSYHRASVE